MEKVITSFSNRAIKEIRSLQTAKNREESGLFLIEGERFVEEALECEAGVRTVLFSESFLANPFKDGFVQNVRELQEKMKYDILITSQCLFETISKTETPQGVIAVASASVHTLGWAELAGHKHVVVLDRIQDPGNMGTIIRTADAFGFGAVIMIKGCVDIYNPKVLRSTMGSIFHVKLITAGDAGECVKLLKESEFITIAADAEGEYDCFGNFADWSKPKAIIIGNEANGVSDEFMNLCDFKVRIPMPGRAESLNAAVAASVLMYEEIRKGMIK